MRLKHFLLIGLAGAVCLLFFAIARSIEGPVPDAPTETVAPVAEEDADSVEQVIYEFELPHYTEGRKDWVVRGEKARRSADGKTVDIENPVITVWNFGKSEKGSPATKPDRISVVRAKTGRLNHESEDAYLSGGVTIEVTDVRGKNEGWIESEDLLWQSKPQIATTDKRVFIRRSGIRIRGIGMYGNVKSGHFEVLDKVEMLLDAVEEAASKKKPGNGA